MSSTAEIEYKIEYLKSQEITGPYVEVVQALRTLEANHLFPLRGAGNITLHYDKQGRLNKIVPQPWIEL